MGRGRVGLAVVVATLGGLGGLGGCVGEPEPSGTPFQTSASGTSADEGGSSDGEAGSSAPSASASDSGESTGSFDTDDPSGGSTSDPTTGGDPGCYGEPLDPHADIADIVASYGPAGYQDAVIEAMQRRYPAGAYLLDAQRDDPYWSQFSDPGSWPGMVGWLDTLVHEQTHLFNAYHAIDVGESAALYMREDLILYLPPEQGFARGEILSELPAALQQSIYADTYLTGDQGERGFGPLLDETAAYVNEVPGMASFGEFYPGQGLSLRDGSAAMLVFLEFYLRRARTQYPDFYAWAQTEPAYVDAVALLWQRAQFFYEEVGDMHPSLGISDAEYRAEAELETNLDELRMFTGLQLQAGPCVLD